MFERPFFLYLLIAISIGVSVVAIVIGTVTLNAVSSCIDQSIVAAQNVLFERQVALVQNQMQVNKGQPLIL